jgi:hypothetical protein
MKKMFVFDVDNVIDLITNSSSELFVLEGNTKQEVTELIESVYPDYLNEYHEVKSLSELDDDELNTYLSYTNDFKTFEAVFAKGWDPMVVFRDISSIDEGSTFYGDLSDEGIELIKSTLNPNTFFLFSIMDNPNWDKQEELMSIASRYHLG